ncbi:TPA: phage holin [Streptococcus pyogenes]
MINLKLRLQNKVTLMAILGAIFLLAQQLGIKLPSNIADIANTAVTLLVLLGVVTDPTTKGLSNSEQALTYHEPKK